MRRASTCLALLGLAVLGLSATASAAPTITLKAKAVPIPGIPHTRRHSRRRRRNQGRIHDLGDRIRRLPAAADRGQVLRAVRREAAPAGIRHVRAGSDRKSGPGPCPKSVDRGPEGQRERRRELRHRTRCRDGVGAAVLRSRRQLGVLRGRHDAGVDRNPLEGPCRQSSPPFGPTVLAEVPLVESVPGALDASTKEINVTVGAALQAGQEDDFLHHGAEEVPEGRLPAEDRDGIRERQQSQGTGRKGRSHVQGAVPQEVAQSGGVMSSGT